MRSIIVLKLHTRPAVDATKPFRALIFDSVFDLHRGVIVYVACVDGEIQRGQRITSFFTKKTYEVQEVGIARPEFTPSTKL